MIINLSKYTVNSLHINLNNINMVVITECDEYCSPELRGKKVIIIYTADNKYIYELKSDLSDSDFEELNNIIAKKDKKNKNHYITNDLLAGARAGNLELVQFIIENAKHIDAHVLQCNKDNALCVSAECGHFELVKYLIENGAKISSFDYYAVCCAMLNKHKKITDYLMKIYKSEK